MGTDTHLNLPTTSISNRRSYPHFPWKRNPGGLERLNEPSVLSQSVGGSMGKWPQSPESQCLRSNSSSLLKLCGLGRSLALSESQLSFL